MFSWPSTQLKLKIITKGAWSSDTHTPRCGSGCRVFTDDKGATRFESLDPFVSGTYDSALKPRARTILYPYASVQMKTIRQIGDDTEMVLTEMMCEDGVTSYECGLWAFSKDDLSRFLGVDV